MIKIAPEGWPFIISSAVFGIAVFLIFHNWLIVIPILILLFMIFFFRDPERNTPTDPNIIASPADGKIIKIEKMYEHEYLKKDVIKISIFMSPFNVHINRAPFNGIVVGVAHNKGGFFAAYKDDASIKNENIAMVIKTIKGDILVRQVAGFIARRAVCRVKPGDTLSTGDRYGLIKFSSRVDLYLPPSVETAVKLNDIVKSGETIIARWQLESALNTEDIKT
ncbi:MAG: phosphatidylserine decarboxylase family protein [Nitrospirae bacterium]|nr:phosphatidylserine decarboxylase family protein [Nitrospirota bacterium]